MSKLLEIGDVYYRYQYGKITGKGKIFRVTAKFAFTQHGIKFKREVSSSGEIKSSTRDRFSSNISYYIESEDHKAIYTKAVKKNRIKKYLFMYMSKWSDEDLSMLYEFTKKYQNKKENNT